MSTAVKVEGLSKRFLLGQNFEHTLSSRVGDLLRGKGLRKSAGREEFWALRDVDFEVAEGEALGIIGGNGAGKSTLLKVLSRITPPTTGRARVKGRLSSLLEVGTGFHPELTGRENVFLNGAILGMRKAEVARKFDEIVSFSGVEKFIDTPVKRYSSGMYVRLAFAVAAHLEPDVLIIDEVLAVGDADFQARCLGKMGEVAREGRTILFVSHNLGAVSRLCSRCVILKQGSVKYFGQASQAIMLYQERERADVDGGKNNALQLLSTQPQQKGPLDVSLSLTEGAKGKVIRTNDDISLGVDLLFEHLDDYGIDLIIEDDDGVPLAVMPSHLLLGQTFPAKRSARHILRIDRLPFAAGEYYISLRITKPGAAIIHEHQRIARLQIDPSDIYGTGFPPLKSQTKVALMAEWKGA